MQTVGFETFREYKFANNEIFFKQKVYFCQKCPFLHILARYDLQYSLNVNTKKGNETT